MAKKLDSAEPCDLCVLLKTTSPLRFDAPHAYLVVVDSPADAGSARFRCRVCSSSLTRHALEDGFRWT